MKNPIFFIAAVSIGFAVSPLCLCAQTSVTSGTASSSPANTTTGRHHRDINEFLDKHPEMKEKVLAQFDTNHNGKLDGDEIKAFKEWRKEHRGEFKRHRKGDNSAASPSPAAAATPAATPTN
jgi:hypothetical protein